MESPNTNYSSPSVQYGYDNNGSLTNKNISGGLVAVYTYNLQNRLKTVSEDASPTVTYSYNTDGIRIEKAIDSGVTTTYLIDPYNPTGYAQVLESSDTSGSRTTYVLGLDILAQKTGTANPVYLLYDGHGSTRMLTDSTGNPVTGQSYAYDAYGSAVGFDPTTADTCLLYTGENHDSSLDMYYLRARYYAPAIGRFNRTDPYAGNTIDPQSLHKYLYAYCNPVNMSDPTGLFTQKFGYLAEDAIQAIYGYDHLGDQIWYGKWTRLLGAFRLKPDIFNRSKKTWLEIKPLSVSGVPKAAVDYTKYAIPLGLHGYRPEISWVPSTHFTVAGSTTIFFFNAGGIVFYTDAYDNAEDLLALTSIAAVKEYLKTAAGRRLISRSAINVFGKVPHLAQSKVAADNFRLKDHLSISAIISAFGVL